MKQTVKSVISLIKSLPYLPHAAIDCKSALCTGGGKLTVKSDVLRNGNWPKDFTPKDIGILDIAQTLSNNEYLRTLFFHRIKHCPLRHLLWGSKSRLEIPYDVEIGAGVKLDHPFSTILNARKIGSGLRVKNNVTIGNKNDDERLRPVIGDNCYIGAGAIIIGNITIGNNVTIGAGAVVVKDVPDNSTVVGNSARIL